ncbi:type III PLP-dependent enzyme [Lichenicoccus roseus]|uniref:ornithine decarboxylase n=1 Tax=Lichenicoccus roseus TaxID=2683649 RepID=A0A5R9J3M5_9PROT|nr:type III PLP-dependent enzyme [Lichenicoccus roseus]TLU71453.1 type III PLP-dependent enzyme [Lichenicoccus roseus]
MSHLGARTAVSVLRRDLPLHSALLPAVDDVVAVEQPSEPLHALRPAAVVQASRAFVNGFDGDVLYAVKCNPDPSLLRAVWDGGVRHFDCASPNEVALVRGLFPRAAIHFMHPVKSRQAIREAWERFGVRDFVLDSASELAKILQETGNDVIPAPERGLGLVVRIALPKGEALLDLSGKFGAPLDEAAALLRAARPFAARLGVSFHVGSQCMDPTAWSRAMELAGAAIRASGMRVDIVDVGGGFPVAYPDLTPPPMGTYFAEIERSFESLGLPAGTRLWAEPGRALVAGGASVVVQVQMRRGTSLYINDGVYGSLSDAGALGFRYPVRRMRPQAPASDASLAAFSFFGPTCDSADVMHGPFLLPDDIEEGDWIEIGQLGAYGACLRTSFNGFDRTHTVEVRDPPLLQGVAPVAPATVAPELLAA